MSTVIQIKRSANVNAPLTTNLAEGEMAYSQDRANDGAGAILYIESVDSGSSAVIHKVGGKYYTDIIDAANSQNSASTLVQRDATGSFSANVITAEQFIGNISVNAVELGTDTFGDYVANVLAGTGIDVSGQGGEIANVTVTLADTAVSPATYGGTSDIPVLVIDQQGRVTSAANVSISTDLAIASDSGTDTVSLATETLAFIGGTGIDTSISGNAVTITNSGVTSLNGTTNEIEVSSSLGDITIGLPNDVTIGGTLSVTGNLFVSGTAFTVGAQDITINDPLIHLANNNTSSDVVDIGFEGHYFDGVTQRHAGLFRDATDGKFKLFANVAVELENATTIDPGATGYDTASLVASLTGGNVYSLASAIGVADGGTGKQSVTTNAILYGQGTSALAEATGSAYQVLQLNGSGVPVFGGIDGGTY